MPQHGFHVAHAACMPQSTPLLVPLCLAIHAHSVRAFVTFATSECAEVVHEHNLKVQVMHVTSDSVKGSYILGRADRNLLHGSIEGHCKAGGSVGGLTRNNKLPPLTIIFFVLSPVAVRWAHTPDSAPKPVQQRVLAFMH